MEEELKGGGEGGGGGGGGGMWKRERVKSALGEGGRIEGKEGEIGGK